MEFEGGYGVVFASYGTKVFEHYACRGTILLSYYHKIICNKCYKTGTGAVPWYKLSRSQKYIMVRDFNWVQMRVSGCKNHYGFVLSAAAKARSVTPVPRMRETIYP
jgi:hypothetical protein